MKTAYDPAYRWAPALRLISDYPAYWANLDADHAALTCGGTTLTYGQLAEEVEETAKVLRAYGVRRGDRVMVLSTPSPAAFTSFLATAHLGAIWVCLNPKYSFDEIVRAISDAEPAVLATIPAFEGRDYLNELSRAVEEAGCSPRLVYMKSYHDQETPDDRQKHGKFCAWPTQAEMEQGNTAIVNEMSPDDPVVLVYTSGTTGTPKGALLPNSGLVRLGIVEAAAFRVPQRPRYLCAAPLNHVGGLADICCTSLICGGTTVFHERFEPAAVLRSLEVDQISVLFAGPTILSSLVAQADFNRTNLSSLKTIAWGGAALSAPVLTRLRELECSLTTTYGQTEAVSSITYSDPLASDDVLINTVGRPDPDLEMTLIKADGTPASIGEPGEVTIRHPTVMTGYWRRPEANDAAFTIDKRLRTGDIGVVLPDGNLRLVGRAKEMYKSGGENIYPREIELLLSSHPDILVAAVVPKPDAYWGEVGIAYVEANEPELLDTTTLSRWLRSRLANYKVPKQIIVCNELPRLQNQKIDKQKLRALAAKSTEGRAGVVT